MYMCMLLNMAVDAAVRVNKNTMQTITKQVLLLIAN